MKFRIALYSTIAWFFSTFVFAAVPPQKALDIEFEKTAYKLELVRNQIELTISNHESVASDIRRQERELTGMRVYDRIPLASQDARLDRELIRNLRADFNSSSERQSGFNVSRMSFKGKWRSSSKKVPNQVPFDIGYRLAEDQIADKRQLQFEVQFDGDVPQDPSLWLQGQQSFVRRLMVPVAWERRDSRKLVGTTWIYRFREFDYPNMVAPDLSRYSAPAAATTPMQKSAQSRIKIYREQIVSMWPKAQPYLTEIRTFARNDARMNFFLKHANVHSK